MVKERRSEKELRQMMLAAARNHEECSELEDLFIFGPMPRPDANWGFGIAGKDNKVSVACYTRLDQIANDPPGKIRTAPGEGSTTRDRSESLVLDPRPPYTQVVTLARRRRLRVHRIQDIGGSTELDNGMDY